MIEQSYDGFKNKETGELYRQLVGGIAWPSGANPGWAVVLGQDYLKDEVLKKYHFRILAESDFINPTDLLRRCFEYKKQFLASPWYGNTSNTVMMDALNNLEINFYIEHAQFAADLAGAQDRQTDISDREAARKLGGTIKAQNLEVTISPTLIIQGEQIFIGQGSVNEFGAEMGSVLLTTMQEALDTQQLDLSAVSNMQG